MKVVCLLSLLLASFGNAEVALEGFLQSVGNNTDIVSFASGNPPVSHLSRHLSNAKGDFLPASCNDNMGPCVSWTSLFGRGRIKAERIAIPCGVCVYMDLPEIKSPLELRDGMDIRGHLEIRNGYRIHIVTTMIVVQGFFSVKATWEIRGEPLVRFTFFGKRDQFFTPIHRNRRVCGGGPCRAGARSFTVAGGQVSLRGIFTKVPTMTHLYDQDSSTSIILRDPNGYLKYWKPGAEIVIASSSEFYDFHQVRTITKVKKHRVPGYLRFELNETVRQETTMRESLLFATEVALLSRNIVLDSPISSGGGHFWITNTPNVKQDIRGLEIVNFGQAGRLGRYPIHIHMCGDLRKTRIIKNSIRNSNQRALVVHATNNLRVEDNVSFDIKGHAFVLEDGIETGNYFKGNIAVYTRNQNILIPPDPKALNFFETDDQASAFWITNPRNSFVDNIVAGAQTTGIWLELQKRGVRADQFPGLNPMEEKLGKFDGNVIHSVPATGFRFYLNGYMPASLQTITGLKIYRCFYGLRSHRVQSVELKGALFADNSYTMFIDLTANFHVSQTNIIGYSKSYQKYVERNRFAEPPCGRSSRTNFGLGFTRDNPVGGSPLNGLFLSNVRFHRFEELPCRRKAALQLVEIPTNYKTFDMGSAYKHVSLEDISLINMCPGTRRGITDVYLSDVTGSMTGSGVPSSIFVNSPEMLKFVNRNRCTTYDSQCLTSCRNTCFRSVFYMINSNDSGKWRLKVCDRNNLDDCHMIHEHEKRSHLRRRFAVHVPSGKKYDAVFVKRSNGAEVYPDDVVIEYQDKLCPTAPDDEDIHLLDIPRGTTYSPTSSPTTFPFRCDNTERNSDMEDGTDHWSVIGLGGMTTTEGYRSQTALMYLGAGRGNANVARIQTTLDAGSCFQEGTDWEFRARLKMTDSASGKPVTCNPSRGIGCPRILLTLRDFDQNLYYVRIQGFSSSYSWKSRSYNLFKGSWRVGQRMRGWNGRARVVRAGFVDFAKGIDLAIDDFQVRYVGDERLELPERIALPATMEDLNQTAKSCYGDASGIEPEDSQEDAWLSAGKGEISFGLGIEGTAVRYHGKDRTELLEGPLYDLSKLVDFDCLGQGSSWEITAQLQLLDVETGRNVNCETVTDESGSSCPSVEIELSDVSQHSMIQTQRGIRRWNRYGYSEFRAKFSVPTESEAWTSLATAGHVQFMNFPFGTDLIIDRFSIKRSD